MMKVASKFYRLLAVAAIAMLLLPYIACGLIKDVPRHTAEEVIAIAKAFSPDCKLQVGEQRHG